MALTIHSPNSNWDLWLSPTVSLSLIIEAETTNPSLTRSLSQFVLLVFRRSLLQEQLSYELSQRPIGPGNQIGPVSSTTLRVVDYAYYKTWVGARNDARGTPIYPQELAATISTVQGIDQSTPAYQLLSVSLERVMAVYQLVDDVIERADTRFDPADEQGQDDLQQLWALLNPNRELRGMTGKWWVEVSTVHAVSISDRITLTDLAVVPCSQLGFQGNNPATDFRDLGTLALDSLLFFARTYGHRAVQVVEESVEGGEYWYPMALGVMHMTAFALDLAKSRDLQLILLRSYQAPRDEGFSRSDQDPPNLGPFLAIASDLFLLFHLHWLRGGYTVMQFEQVSKEFQNALRPWIRRGVIDSRALGWETGNGGKVE
ncbi:BQ2448_2100 [Microbotryum intermedium]|uniref:BQ2448_2100 protein n=1 Tax=Microbotryum intermedium TaxID=269621 RepID=A0A238F5A5_9BASI|nr:BQ2448_2100 [Microbotryum intermedium]